MNKHLRWIPALGVAIASLVLSSTPAHAEDFSLKFNSGAAIPYVGSQFNAFKVGIGADAQASWLLGHNFAIGPQVSAFTLEPREGQTYRHTAADVWSFEGAFRIQGDHSSPGWIEPWIGGSGGVSLIGHLTEPVIDGSVGLDIATEKSHAAWLGVYAKISHTFLWNHGNNDNAVTHGDTVDTVTIGLSGTFDFPGRTVDRVINHTQYVPQYVPVLVTVHEQDAAPEPTPAAPLRPIHAMGKVYFNVDSSTLDWRAKDALDALASHMAARVDLTVNVVGNASKDHPKMTAAQTKHDADLAQARGQAVSSYLQSKGIDAKRISVGETSGGGTNDTQEARERNRNSTLTVETSSQ